jgi:hypothetical protein
VAVAWSPGAAGHVVDYGRLEVASVDLGVEQALLAALREFRDLVLGGWPRQIIAGAAAPVAPVTPAAAGGPASTVVADQVWVDSGYMAPVVYAFCREAGERFRPAVGRGASQQRNQYYNRPTQTGSIVKFIGEAFHANWLPAEQLYLLESDADHWKTWVHQRLSTPMGAAGAMTLFTASPQEHLALAKHLTAETKTEEFVIGRGVVVKWERLRRQNHWLDALYNACAAGHLCGARLVEEQIVHTPAPEPVVRAETAENWWLGRTWEKGEWMKRW